jgi:hypothetical protein
VSSQEECKNQAIELVGRAWTVNPPLRGGLLAEAQVWATLATVPDEIIEVRQLSPDIVNDPAHIVAVKVMERLADLAENAGKHRTEEWLRACVQAYTDGRPFPPAPRYKGPLQDLDALTDDMLDQLEGAIRMERRKRQGKPWKSGGGAGQWNG